MTDDFTELSIYVLCICKSTVFMCRTTQSVPANMDQSVPPQPTPSIREAAIAEEKPTAAANVADPSLQLGLKNTPHSTPALQAVDSHPPPPVDVTKKAGNVELEQQGVPGAASEWGRAAAEDDIPDPEMDVAVELAAAAMMEKKSIYDDALRTTLQRRKGMHCRKVI
jgi:hypothetical protein